MQALEHLKSFGEVNKFSKVCEVPDWLKNAVDGIDNVEINAKIEQLRLKQLECLAKLEEIQDSNCISSIHQAIKKNKQENKLSVLSKRELEVLINISKGFSNKEIGSLMYLSEKSIKNYATNIFKKLNVHDRVQAAYISYENSLDDYYKEKYKDRD